MKSSTKPRVSALLSFLTVAAAAGAAGCPAPDAAANPAAGTTKTKEPPVPLTIDLQAHPSLKLRIDAFTVPAASRAEFETLMHRNVAFIEKLPGFMNHMVFEKTDGPTTFNIVTIAVWENPEAIAAARDKVRAYYQSIGFDMPVELSRLGITASLGYYRAPPELQ